MLFLLSVAVSGPLAGAAAQAPVAGQAQVIAQGTAWLPADPVAWWVTQQAAPAALPQSPFRHLGFVLGDQGTTTIITEGVPGDQLVWLDPGEALFVPRDIHQDRSSTGFPAAYYAIELLPATVVPDPPAFQGSASFLPIPDLYELSLLRDVLIPGATSALPASPYPTLILATSGAVVVTPEQGQGVILEAGQAASVEGNVGVAISAAGSEVGSYVAAVIASRNEQAPSSGVADLGIWVWTCPPGVTARPDMSEAGCAITDPLASGLEVNITGSSLATPLTLANSGFGDAGARVWPTVPFGTYTLTATLPPGAAGYAVRPGTDQFAVELRPDGTGYTFTIDGGLFDLRSDYWRVNLDVYLLYP